MNGRAPNATGSPSRRASIATHVAARNSASRRVSKFERGLNAIESNPSTRLISASIPQPIPLLKPFEEALDFQKTRTPLTAENFHLLDPAARPRAFTIAGLQKYASLLEADRLVEKAIDEGMTKADFTDLLGKIVDEHGGTILPPSRFDLIYDNAMVTCDAAGRWRQMTDPDVVSARPILRYSDKPNDGRTTPFCRELQGFMAPYDDPAWEHIFIPNHHHERHWIDSLTEEEAGRLGEIYRSPKGSQYPHVNGRTLLPDPGFDFSPADAFGGDDNAIAAAARKLGDAIPAKTPGDYELDALSAIDVDGLPASPRVGRAISRFSDSEYEAAWKRFADVVDIDTEASRGAWLLDYGTDGVRVNRATFDELLGIGADEEARKALAGNAKYFDWIEPTLDDPAEVWFVPVAGEDGSRDYVKRYLGVFRAGDKQAAVKVAIDRSPEGWAMRIRFGKSDSFEELRRGLLVRSKARKQ
jgi:hypothetical protein